MIIVSRILDFNTTRGLVILICKFLHRVVSQVEGGLFP